MMMQFHTIWLIVVHYTYDSTMEFIVDAGDHFVSHYVFVLVLKAGVIHAGWLVVKRVRKGRVKPK